MRGIVALLTLAFAFTVPLAGCNTMKGAGQDVQKAGEKMESAAERKK